MKIKLLLFLNVFFLSEAALANSPKVYFIEPANGAFVQETFKVKFGLENFLKLVFETDCSFHYLLPCH